MKRKIRVHGKINLMETSAVGIPAYPYAHASANIDSFSLIKALSMSSSEFVDEANDVSDQLNMEKKEMSNEIEPSIDKAEPAKEIEDKKSDMSEIIAKAIKEGIKEGLDKLQTERGLIERQTIPQKEKSLGEMAIDQGLFVK